MQVQGLRIHQEITVTDVDNFMQGGSFVSDAVIHFVPARCAICAPVRVLTEGAIKMIIPKLPKLGLLSV